MRSREEAIMAQPKPIRTADDPREVNARLAMMGVIVTPATVRPDTPIPEPLLIPGVSLSETVVQMRREAETE
jgi:hypothetical protein